MEIKIKSFSIPALVLIIQCYCLFMARNLAAEAAATTSMNITTDESALVALKSNLKNIDPSHIIYKNWSASTSVCNWIGVTCGSRHERVRGLNLSSMGLEGHLVPQLGNLSFLVSLDLGSNNFQGTLNQELGGLRRLRVVNLSFNNIGGDIPSWFGNSFPQLQILRLRNNTLTGIIPPSLCNMSKLEILDLSYNPLQGVIPKEIGDLQNLRILGLQDNQLTGSIPSVLFNMSKLEQLSLIYNSLSGTLPDTICRGLPGIQGLYLGRNELSGKIPMNISDCSKLQLLELSYNKFQGFIPEGIGNMQALQILNLGYNNLEGEIPEALGNATSLEVMELYSNQLVGSIPLKAFNISSLRIISLGKNRLSGMLPGDMFSSLQQLEVLNLEENELSGFIPSELYHCSSMQTLSLSDNRFRGPISRDVANLTLLENLYLSENNFTGEVPSPLFNISTLRILSCGWNQLTGNLPSDMGYGLPNLELLSFPLNNLGSESSDYLNFITSLTNCRYLRTLAVSDNPLNGSLPASIGNLSSTLERIYMYNCGLKGSIPHEIGNLSELITLSLYNNHLTNSLPESMGNLESLQVLSLTKNKIYVGIPITVCKLVNLYELWLNDNQIGGSIPYCIGNLTSLRQLQFGINKLNSTIPANMWRIEDLQWLNLSSNSFSGTLTSKIGSLKSAVEIDLSNNQFSGVIPDTVGGLITLTSFFLHYNNFQGHIPESMAQMVSLENIDLSHNMLSGQIPASLQNLRHLLKLNVSFNNLSGEIPSDGPFRNFSSQSFLSNQGLCGDSKYNVPSCPIIRAKRSTRRLKLVIMISSVLISIIVLVLGLTYIARKYEKKQRVSLRSYYWFVPTPLRFSYYELLEATERYSESRKLGTGGYGSVFRGTLRNGTDIAVKVFNLSFERAQESFEVECKVLRELRHKNLCKVIGSCSNQDFKALVLEYMPSGSLEKWLYSHNYFLDLFQRVNIMIDLASALEYLHYGYSTPIVHCDLKPSNVLLDENMTAHISDFGLSKLLDDGESTTRTMTLATLGYIAPEFGTDGLVSICCDVYSYGIMLIEVFTRVRPSDETLMGNLTLRSWVKDAMPNGTINIIDSNLLKTDDKWLSEKLNCVSSILELALHCSMESPSERINIKDVRVALEKIKLQLHVYC